MGKTRVEQIMDDIKAYAKAINDAEGAMAQAELELADEVDRNAFDIDDELPEE